MLVACDVALVAPLTQKYRVAVGEHEVRNEYSSRDKAAIVVVS